MHRWRIGSRVATWSLSGNAAPHALSRSAGAQSSVRLSNEDDALLAMSFNDDDGDIPLLSGTHLNQFLQRRHLNDTALEDIDMGNSPAATSTGASAALGPIGRHDEALMSAVDVLCDDLFLCKHDVLKQFARSRGVFASSKIESIVRLIEKAHHEAHGESGDLSHTRRVLGDVFDEEVRTSGLRTRWTNKALEASHVELACERHAKLAAMSNASKAMMVRKNGAEAAKLLRMLTRPFQDEYASVTTAAVGGVYRVFKEELDSLVSRWSTTEMVSPFCAYLVSAIRHTTSANLLTRSDTTQLLVQADLIQPSVEDGNTATLESYMTVLDRLVEEVDRRDAIFGDQRIHWGTETGDILIDAVRSYEANLPRWSSFDEVPEWVQVFTLRFASWERIIRNDVPIFADVSPTVFHVILLGVASWQVLHMIHGQHAKPSDIPRGYTDAVRKILLAHFQDEAKTADALSRLGAYTQVSSEGTTQALRADMFACILQQLQSAFHDGSVTTLASSSFTRGASSTVGSTAAAAAAAVPSSSSSPSSSGGVANASVLSTGAPYSSSVTSHSSLRAALVLREATLVASRCERSYGLYPLMIRLTEDLRFHMRFAEVFRRLNTKDKDTIRNTSVNMIKTLHYFEKELHIAPVSTKAVAFLVVVLLYLSSRSNGSQPAILERYASVTGKLDFDVVGLSELAATSLSDLRVALPPQLTYNSWLEQSDTKMKSVYSVVPSVAVKGVTNQAMIVSQAPMMRALDAISKVPWRINQYMLHVQEGIVREGFGFGKIRPGFYPLHYCNKKSGEIHHLGLEQETVYNTRQRTEYTQQQDRDWRNLQDLRSTRVHYLQALRQARSLVQFSHLYFPNSMDFRGRMYPIPGRLNHTGSDPFRALLEYAEPKPLGAVGLYWLKVHVANKMGMNKLSFDERVQYVDEHITDVVESAESPLQGQRWWQEASEPLQCLMACKELADALKCSQGPENFLSRIGVAVDGSYNGLQHYSAIGRDQFGAELVNLVPSERPADAYTGILKEMMKVIEADAARDNPIAQRCMGTGKGMDRGHIKRKTIKRPIMTQVYGVTGYGMSEQILEELVKQNASHGLWTVTDMKEMAGYLREKVLDSLGVTFRETQQCRKWLSEVTELIWEAQPAETKNPFCWTTPLGLVVRQPYRVRKEHHLFTIHGYSKIPGDSVSPASRKQLSALAPNLIHSLDATHLAMTALDMQERGLSMMAVHDSYWTYACDLPTLSSVLRQQFVHLYSQYDPLWELKEQWEESFFFDLRRHGVRLPDPPQRGTLDLNVVLQSQYFFS